MVEPGREGAERPPRLPPGLPARRDDRALPRARAAALAGAHAAGRGGAQRHAAGERPDDVPAALPEVRARLHRDEPAGLPGVLRAAPRAAAAAHGATRRSSTRRSSTARAPTARPTSAASPTSCRSPRRSGGRWRASTGPGSARRSTRRCGRTRPGARRRGVGGGLRVPDQPRPRRRRRRPHPAQPGRPRAAGAWPRAGTKATLRGGAGRQQPATRHPLADPVPRRRVPAFVTASPRFRDGESPLSRRRVSAFATASPCDLAPR